MPEDPLTTETQRHRQKAETRNQRGASSFYSLISAFCFLPCWVSVSLCLCGELADFFTPSYGLPIAYTKCSVRKKMCPSEIAGELKV